ncbi:hypothetical protein ABS735_38590 [Streptomyces sp. MMCC 100]|uniref:hypothetical protein n=1 Tax=Streptomyces sp. MMCC 100 TaxID=3163555 RepID=UPI0035967365
MALGQHTAVIAPGGPSAGRFDHARPLLLTADCSRLPSLAQPPHPPGGRLQLPVGRAGLWYDYESEPGCEDRWPRGTPDGLDPVGALTGLGTVVDQERVHRRDT